MIFLETYFLKAGIKVQNAGIESDAGVVIVKNAIELSQVMKTIIVMAVDTYILILMLYHSTMSANIFLQTKNKTISIRMAKEFVGR